MLLAPEFEGAMAQSFSCGPSERGLRCNCPEHLVVSSGWAMSKK